ncbi:MFS transporter [Desulfosporosinus fructosivorans]
MLTFLQGMNGKGYLSFIVDSHKFGNAASSGVATMLMTLGGLIMGIFFWRITKLLKKFTLFVGIIFNMLGFFILSIATSMPLIFIGSLIVGLGFGFLMPTSVLKITDASAKSATTFTNGLLMTFINSGTAIFPVILVSVGNVFHNSDGQFIFQFCSILLLIAAVIALILVFIPQKANEVSHPESIS